MSSRIAEVLHVAPETRPAKKAKPRKPAAVKPPMPVARKSITIGLGVGVPCLSLALSSIGGQLLAAGSQLLGVGFLGLCVAVLAVSLSHLAWAIRDVTRSAWWQAWCLGGAIDLALVLGELAGVAGLESWLTSAVMVGVGLASAGLNCWAFLGHRR
jgi:hypothetical protein